MDAQIFVYVSTSVFAVSLLHLLLNHLLKKLYFMYEEASPCRPFCFTVFFDKFSLFFWRETCISFKMPSCFRASFFVLKNYSAVRRPVG